MTLGAINRGETRVFLAQIVLIDLAMVSWTFTWAINELNWVAFRGNVLCVVGRLFLSCSNKWSVSLYQLSILSDFYFGWLGTTFGGQLFVNEFIMISTDKRFCRLSFPLKSGNVRFGWSSLRKNNKKLKLRASCSVINSTRNVLKVYRGFINTSARINRLFITVCTASIRLDALWRVLWLPESKLHRRQESSPTLKPFTTVTITTLTSVILRLWVSQRRHVFRDVFSTNTFFMFGRFSVLFIYFYCTLCEK